MGDVGLALLLIGAITFTLLGAWLKWSATLNYVGRADEKLDWKTLLIGIVIEFWGVLLLLEWDKLT